MKVTILHTEIQNKLTNGKFYAGFIVISFLAYAPKMK